MALLSPLNSTHAEVQEKIKKTGCECAPPGPVLPMSLVRAYGKARPDILFNVIKEGAAENVQ